MDRMIAHYPHGFKNRKWYLLIFFHFLNISIIHSWTLFKKSIDPNLPLVQFKASSVWTLLQLGKQSPKRGRKSDSFTQLPPKKKPTRVVSTPAEIRYDNNNHYPLKTYAKMRIDVMKNVVIQKLDTSAKNVKFHCVQSACAIIIPKISNTCSYLNLFFYIIKYFDKRYYYYY